MPLLSSSGTSFGSEPQPDLLLLVHAVEQSGVKLLSLTSEISELVGGMARITLKVNTTDTARVRHMLEHYGYTVVGTFNEHMDEKDLHLRVQEFLRYLEA